MEDKLLEKKKLDYLSRVSSFLLLMSILLDRVFDYAVVYVYLPKIVGVVLIVAYSLDMIYQYRYAKRGKKYTIDMIFDIGVICLSIYMIVS